jgi:hypothetical protein
MKGMGTDAFFASPARQSASTPASQDAGKELCLQADMPVSQQDSTPPEQYEKATFYLSRRHVMRLEQLRLERMQRGEKVDKSALVREAIDKLQ